jgi:UDP-N-acetylmuramate dehydrogenase
MLLEENKPLAPFTTLGIGGPARWFTTATTEADVAEAAAWARKNDVPLFVLGGGSNILISDSGFNGLVLRIGLHGITKIGSEVSAAAGYQVAAGEDWDAFVVRTVDDGCAGVECLAGIPGTVGGTPVQNVGAYGQEVSSAIERVRAFDLEDHDYVEFATDECGFAYRQSRFNTSDKRRYIVTRVDYRLLREGAPTLRYADLQKAFAEIPEPSLKDVAAVVRRIRQSKGMLLVDGDPDCRSAGSFFKNPVVPKEQIRQIAENTGKQPPCFPAGQGKQNEGRVKVPAAWLIEQAGFTKGYTLGAAGVSPRHTLALINRGEATAMEILALAEQIKSAVTERFGIKLEMEPVKVGFDSGTF